MLFMYKDNITQGTIPFSCHNLTNNFNGIIPRDRVTFTYTTYELKVIILKKYSVKYTEQKPFADLRPETKIMTQQELVKLLTSGKIIELISIECME